MKKNITDLCIVYDTFTDGYGDTHRKGSIHRYNRDKDNSFYFQGSCYSTKFDKVVSIQDATIKTLENRGLLNKQGKIIKTKAKDYIDVHTYGNIKIAYFLLDENIVNDRKYLAFSVRSKAESYNDLQEYINSGDPHGYYGVSFAMLGVVPISPSAVHSAFNQFSKFL